MHTEFAPFSSSRASAWWRSSRRPVWSSPVFVDGLRLGNDRLLDVSPLEFGWAGLGWAGLLVRGLPPQYSGVHASGATPRARPSPCWPRQGQLPLPAWQATAGPAPRVPAAGR